MNNRPFYLKNDFDIANEFILAKVSKKLDIPISTIKKVIKHQSQFTKDKLQEGFSIRWKYFGIFKNVKNNGKFNSKRNKEA